MATTVFPKPSGWADGSEDISFSIATTDWSAVTGGYEAEVISTRFTTSSIEIVTFDSSIANYLTANITHQKDAANNKLVFFTASMPTGTINGNICSIISLSTSVSSGEKGVANGVATLNANAKVTDSQMPIPTNFTVVDGKLCIIYYKEVDE